jgi:hypothetical protein
MSSILFRPKPLHTSFEVPSDYLHAKLFCVVDGDIDLNPIANFDV